MAATAPALGLQLAHEVRALVRVQGTQLHGRALWLEHESAHLLLNERLRPGSEFALTLLFGVQRVNLLATVLISRMQPQADGPDQALHMCTLTLPPRTSKAFKALLEVVNPRSGGAGDIELSVSSATTRRRIPKPAARHVPSTRARRRLPPRKPPPQAIPKGFEPERRNKRRPTSQAGLRRQELAHVTVTAGPPPELFVRFWDQEHFLRSAQASYGRLQVVLADTFQTPVGTWLALHLSLPTGATVSLQARIAHRGRGRVVLEAQQLSSRIWGQLNASGLRSRE